MRAPTAVRGRRALPLSQVAARLVVLLGPLVALLAAAPAGDPPAPWVWVLAVAASTAWAARPDSDVGVLALLLVVVWWALVPGDALHPSVLVAAVAVVAAHVAAVLADAAPAPTPLDPRVVRRWVGRGAVVLVPVPVLWTLARALEGQGAPPGLWPAALLAVLLVLAALVAVLDRPGGES